jgi:hypothetical protein
MPVWPDPTARPVPNDLATFNGWEITDWPPGAPRDHAQPTPLRVR